MADEGSRQGGSWLRIVSRCETPESFFATFSRYVDAETIFIATSKPKSVGERRRIAIQLADGHTMLNGEAEVVESLPDGGGPDGRSGMRLKILSLEQRSQSVFFELMRRASARRILETTPPRIDAALPDPPPAATPLPDRLPRPEPGLVAPPRLAGSSITLPANPLCDVTVEDIKGFVECTLFEESDVLPAGDTMIVIPSSPLVKPAAAAEPDEGTTTPLGKVPGPARGVSLPVTIAISAVTAVGGALAGAFLVRPPSDVPPAEPVAAAVEPPAPEPAAAPEPAPEPPPLAAPAPAPAPRTCSASVHTTPVGAVVRWNGKKIGVTPLDAVTVPCGEAKVVLDRPRYEVVERAVTAAAGEPLRLELTLSRPSGRLHVLTTPPGATVTVNGAEVGRSPARASVAAFTTVKVSAALPGHRPWTKTVYVRGRDFKVAAALTPVPARRSSARAKAAAPGAASDPR